MYTITGKTDGFGAQYQSVMSGIAICEFKKLKYIHSPFVGMEHDCDVALMNDFIGISADDTILPNNIIKEGFAAEVHWAARPSLYYTPAVLQKIRNHYYSTAKPTIPFIDIAIHIRRGDVNKEAHPDRYVDNTDYIKIITGLRNKYPERKITVFSEGTVDDFKGLEADVFTLNGSVTETFHSLVQAKILVTSRSSFSYAAALLNENTVYYFPFWHKKLDHWISL